METIILFAPLIGALLAGLTWRVITDTGAQWTATGFVVFAAILSWVLWFNFDGVPQQVYVLDWIRSGTLDAALAVRLDAISAEMLVVVTSTSAVAHLYAMGFMERDKAFDEGRSFRPRLFAYLSLFTFAMLLLVTSDNLLQLVLGLNLSSVMAYLLIGFRHHYKSANAAAIKSFTFAGIGNVGLILGVAGLFMLTDSLALDDVFDAISDASDAPLIAGLSLMDASAALILIGAMAVSAQVVLHVWVPDAMEAPAPAAALLTALLVCSGAFLIWRLAPIFEAAPGVSSLMVWVGIASALLAALCGSAQKDVKRALGFIASAQMGLIFVAMGLGLALGTRDVVSIQIPLFVVSQALLVLCVGAVTRAMDDSRDLRQFGGLRPKLPAVAVTMMIAAVVATGFGVSQAGLGLIAPETGNLLFGVSHATQPLAFWGMCLAAGLGVFAIWRIVFLCFAGPSRARQDVFDAVETTPRVMVFALAFLGALMLTFVVWEVNTFRALPGVSTPGWISLSPVIATGAGFALALWMYVVQPGMAKSLATSFEGLHVALKHGLYFDALYDRAVTAPLKRLSEVFSDVGDGRIFVAPFNALGTRLVVSYASITDRRFGGVLLGAGAIVFFGLLAVITWTVLSGDPA